MLVEVYMFSIISFFFWSFGFLLTLHLHERKVPP
jgi:hypothetical protein